MPRPRRALRLLTPSLSLLAALGACVPGGAPRVAPRGTLQPGAEGPAPAEDGPFAVVQAVPTGELREVPEVSVTFSRPLRALDGSSPPPPVTMTPQPAGTWDWVGTRALRFSPEKALPAATSYEVEVRGARSLDGATLAPYRFAFSTPRPRVVASSPAHDARGLRPDTTVKLTFNQPVDDAGVRAAVSLARADSHQGAVAFDLRRPDPADLRRVELVPRAPLAIHTTYQVRVDERLRGTEGPLDAGSPFLERFHTYDELSAALDCDDQGRRCAPGGGVTVRLNNPVRRGDLRRAIAVEPAVKIDWPAWSNDKETTTYLRLEGAFLPGRRYTVRVRPGLRDVHGQTLGRELGQSFEIADLPPAFHVGVRGGVLEPSEVRELPLSAMNLAGPAEVAVAPLDLEGLVALEGEGRAEQLGRVFVAPGARKVTVRSVAGRNRVHRQTMRIDDLPPGHRGPLAVAARWTVDGRERTQLERVQVTDLGLSAKVGPGESLAWVTRLSSGQPVAGAQVEVFRPGETRAAASVRTDAQGLARLPAGALGQRSEGERAASALLVARDGADWTAQRADDTLDPWRFGAQAEESERPPTLGLLFTERGVYRPGDTVRLKGVARQGTSKGMSTPAGRTARVTVRGPEGDTVSEFDTTLSPFGSFAHDVALPPGSKLGSYRVQATLDPRPTRPAAGGDDHDGQDEPREPWSASFDVAEYRAAEFKAAAETDRPSYRRGDELRCTGQGTYLFGAPMAGSTARLRVTHAPTGFTPPGLEGFTTSDEAFLSDHDERSPRAGLLHESEQKLDAQGRAQATARLDLPGQSGPSVVTCESEVIDLSRQTFAAATTAVVHPGELYAALRPLDSHLVEVGAPLRAEVLAVQPDGVRRPGVAAQVELLERRYTLARQAAGEGEARTSVTVVDRPVGSCAVTTATAPRGCELRPAQAGHHVVRVTVTDPRGNRVSASRSVYAVSGAGASGGWRDRDDGTLKLVTDRATYRAGDTARVLIQSPFREAEALVTVEREGVLWQKVIPVRGPAPTVEIPVTEAFLPNVHVAVLLVRGRTKRSPGDDHAADLGAPAFRVGYAPLTVDTTSRRLQVAVRPSRAELHPGDELSVDLDVRDAAGRGARAEVTLYAVDEGVLALTGYRTPDPLDTFFAARGVQLRTLEAREQLARIARRDSGVALGLDKGLDGGDGGASVRRDFRQTAYFNPAIVTDDRGHARVSFRLPEGLTTYRLMAVAAASDDRFGAAQERVVTSQPLMARPALPRHLRAGDRMEAGVVVTSKGPSGQFDVSLAAPGLTLEGDGRRSLALATGQSHEVRFAVAAPHAGPVKLRFDVQGEGARDAVEVTREVRSPTVIEAAALSGDTGDAAGERLGDLGPLRDDVGGLEVSLSPTALAGLAGGVEQLIEYPYGCTEQLTSRLVPLLPLRDLAGALGLTLPERVDEAVRTTVGKVLQNQHDDGSFGLWPESESGYPWLTAYALWGLGEAQRRGVPVRPSALRAATRSLRDSLARDASDLRGLTERAFVLDVLAEQGEPDAGALGQLFDRRARLTTAGQAQLLHALVLARADRALIDRLAAELTSGLRLDGPHAIAGSVSELDDLLDSPTRSTALALRALVAATPSHPLAPRLALGLLAARRGGRWRTTQETAWALLALDAYRRAQEASPPAFDARVFLGQAVLAETRFDGKKLAFQSHTPMSALQHAGGQTLAFQKQGSGHLFYEARLRFARRQPPAAPVDHGLFVDRSSRVVTPRSLPDALRSRSRGLATSLVAGDLVLVDLTVVAPSDRQFVVLDDPLPAGLEAVDTSLRGAASWAQDADTRPVDDERDDAWPWDSPVTRRELRDDRVLFFADSLEAGVHHYRYLARATTIGTFQAPPARMEEMYTPETYGQTAAATITVAPRP